MQSSGGLKDASLFMGKDAILSGPAGGIVGAARTCELNGFTKIVGFDMGGTSTDVCHYKVCRFCIFLWVTPMVFAILNKLTIQYIYIYSCL
jgi:N-methylhydantoinase A/oxoprolinase/acetone carboxylase beta subunit